MDDFYKLRKLLEDNLKLEVREVFKNEMEISIKFGDRLIDRKRWRK